MSVEDTDDDEGFETIAIGFEKLGLKESAFMARQIRRFRATDPPPPDRLAMFWSIAQLELRIQRLESSSGLEEVPPRQVADLFDDVLGISPEDQV